MSEAISVAELFKVGIGPSSSHTVGPMVAAHRFVRELSDRGDLDKTARVATTLFGSLSLTGIGHGTDKAVILGLCGEQPDAVDPDTVEGTLHDIAVQGRLPLLGTHTVTFDAKRDLEFAGRLPTALHPNAMTLQALGDGDTVLHEQTYYSVGGGFVMSEHEARANKPLTESPDVPHPFRTGEDLLVIGKRTGLSIADIVLANESAWRPEEETLDYLDHVWDVMQGCIKRGVGQTGQLPGGLNVKRRAPDLYAELSDRPEQAFSDATAALDWINLYALAVNEENAAGGRVVTAPTNGAAGIIPAVLRYYERFCAGSTKDNVRSFLLTAAGIGMLYKHNASISGAEVGCQGEVGVACSMAAAGLTAAWGGSNEQIENAAEIGMEHNLGLTCDPVGGLVQIPCIERNAMGAVKAINAARMALRGDGTHKVSLDDVIETMRQTGLDMQDKYKETSEGGLAVNVVEC